jgi:hypothetical protein
MRCVRAFRTLTFFCGVFARFSTRGFQKHPKNLLKKVHVKDFVQKYLREKKTYFLTAFARLFPSVLLIAFLAVFLHEELKNTCKRFLFPLLHFLLPQPRTCEFDQA